jgi:hypothetical protein
MTLELLRRQDRAPDLIAVAPGSDADIEGVELAANTMVVHGPRGLPAQRNTILAAVPTYDVLIFLDDDFFASATYVSSVEAAFTAYPDLVVATGVVTSDGALGPGLSPEEGLRALQETDWGDSTGVTDTLAGYGCNMSIRLAPVFRHQVRFDENLPLYAWLEDWDFSAALRKATGGHIRKFSSMRGVHLGAKSGKQPGYRLGYSQVANPLYLAKKRTLPRSRLYALVRRNVMANMVRVFRPEPHIDRWGRLRGNMRAFLDLATGRCSPKRIESF